MQLKRMLVAVSVLMLTVVGMEGTSAQFEPKKPVDFVIMAGQGGGADKMARLMQLIIEKKNLLSKPFVPINKPSSPGPKAWNYPGPPEPLMRLVALTTTHTVTAGYHYRHLRSKTLPDSPICQDPSDPMDPDCTRIYIGPVPMEIRKPPSPVGPIAGNYPRPPLPPPARIGKF